MKTNNTNSRKKSTLLGGAVLVLASFTFMGAGFAAEIGSALKNDSIRAEPYADGKITGAFVRGESVEIIKKQGAWLQVKAKKTTGWVRLLSVKRGTSATGSTFKGATAVASGRAGTGQVVSTTGIRGLSEQELKAAKFNETEVNLLESYTLSADKGKAFANAGGLKTVEFANLTAPTNTSNTSGTSTNSSGSTGVMK